MRITPKYFFRSNTGFTIVELLVVIVVIGILAAITIVAYRGISERAHVAAITSDFSTLSKKLELYRIDNDSFPKNSAAMNGMELRMTGGAYKTDIISNLHYCRSADFSQYVLIGITKNGKKLYQASGTSAIREYTGPEPLDDMPCPAMATISGVPVTTGWSGYVRTDATYGPWRAWTGVSN